MRRLLCVVLVGCMCFGALVGCGNSKGKIPEDMSESIYNCGVKAVKVIDKYLNADFTLKEVEDEIEKLADQARELQNDDAWKDSSVYSKISFIKSILWDMQKAFETSKTDDDIRITKDELAKLLEIE